jgi:hypothetical protein
MAKRISTDVRQQVLQLLKQGSRARSISHHLGLTPSLVQKWQAMFDHGDVSWITASQHHWTVHEAWQAIELFKSGMSYTAAAHAMGMGSADVRRFVINAGKYGVPILKKGRHAQNREVKHMPEKSCDLREESPSQAGSREAQLDREKKELKILLECFMASVDKHLGGTEGRKKKISFLTQQLQEHLAQGYPLPNFAEKPIPAGVPITAVLEFLANECLKIRLSMNASRLSKSTTKADTEAGE